MVIDRLLISQKCDSGDVLMADKAFTVQDFFLPHKGKEYLPHETIMEDRLVTKHRIHIERIVELVKTYKFLSSKLNHNYVPLASEIVAVVVMLCNFQEDITDE